MLGGNAGQIPGTGALVNSSEAQIWFGRQENQLFSSVVVGSTATDAGNTPTTVLRTGLLMAKKTSDSKFYPYSASATDGTQIAVCVLNQSLNMLDFTGVAADHSCPVLVGGNLKASTIIGLDAQARAQLTANGFRFDDDLASGTAMLGRPLAEVSKAADYTVTAADNGKLFTAITGAVNFTLPTLAPGLAFEFLNLVDANMTITGSTNIVAMNNLSASSIAFSTSSKKIGGHVMVYSNSAGTKWYVRNWSDGAQTITVA